MDLTHSEIIRQLSTEPLSFAETAPKLGEHEKYPKITDHSLQFLLPFTKEFMYNVCIILEISLK
jgi:hypothetical protein